MRLIILEDKYLLIQRMDADADADADITETQLLSLTSFGRSKKTLLY